MLPPKLGGTENAGDEDVILCVRLDIEDELERCWRVDVGYRGLLIGWLREGAVVSNAEV